MIADSWPPIGPLVWSTLFFVALVVSGCVCFSRNYMSKAIGDGRHSAKKKEKKCLGDRRIRIDPVTPYHIRMIHVR